MTARYLFPVEGPPLPGGLLTIEDGRIVGLRPGDGSTADLNLGNVAITPGFVNAHTHLELAPLRGPGPAALGTENFVVWLRRVIDQRRGGSSDSLRETVGRNLAESLLAGTSLLADTTTAGLSWDQVVKAPVRALVFAELIGLKRDRGSRSSEDAWDWIASLDPDDRNGSQFRPGLSPHAPYSTAGWLYHRAAASRLPLSTHLAEMPEELEFLETRGGPLRPFLEDLGAWDDDWEPIGPRPSDYIRRGDLRNADWLIAHGTYFEPSEFWQLRPEASNDGQRVAVAYCPRTHARFGHAPHPYRAMLERGVVVCLGTDSLASTPTLSILDEIRFLHRRDDSLPGALLLTMATLFGAWALRMEKTTGSLQIGKSADLAVIPLPDRDAEDPHLLLLDSTLPVAATMFADEFVSGKWTGVQK
ncbi:MAG: amidohydrolase family protein [Isosphaeraceae bacterium]